MDSLLLDDEATLAERLGLYLGGLLFVFWIVTLAFCVFGREGSAYLKDEKKNQ